MENIRTIGREDLLVFSSNGIFTIKTTKSGTCYALQNGKCEIYEARPSICKAYPLYLDLFAGLCSLKECPAFSKACNETTMKPAIRSLIDVYQYWIDMWKKRI